MADSEAGFYDGNRLYALCGRSDVTSQAECGGYIMGIVDAIADTGEIRGYTACEIRKKATEAQIIDWVKHSLADRPQLRGNEASMLVASALSWKFVCPMPRGTPPCCSGKPN